jgi:hypothetical protein
MTGRRLRCCRPLAATARPACCWLGTALACCVIIAGQLWPRLLTVGLTAGCGCGDRHRRTFRLRGAARPMAWLPGGTVVPGASPEDSTRIGTFG